MIRYLILSSIEQLFLVRRSFSDFYPVIPLSLLTGNNVDIIGYLKRKRFPLAFLSTHDHEIIPEICDEIWLFSSHRITRLRERGYTGNIRLFCGAKEAAYPEFFKKYSATPVITGQTAVDAWERTHIETIYLTTDTACVASYGKCINSNGELQTFISCDGRCRLKSSDRHAPPFPLSIRPERYYPKTATGIAHFSRALQAVPPSEGTVLHRHLEKVWNYRYPIGKEIITKAVALPDGRWKFPSVTKKQFQEIDNGTLSFWGYRRSLYDGFPVTPVSKQRTSSSVILAFEEDISTLLLVRMYDQKEYDFLKQARHFIHTIPLTQPPATAHAQPLPELTAPRTFSLIVDDPKQKNLFPAKEIKELIVRYRGTLPRGFKGRLLLDRLPDEQVLSVIKESPAVTGIVTTDEPLKHALLIRGITKPVTCYPLALPLHESPTLYSCRTPLFTTDFTAENGKNYRWDSLKLKLVHTAGSVTIEHFRFLRRAGGNGELWVDISGAAPDIVRRMKRVVESLIH